MRGTQVGSDLTLKFSSLAQWSLNRESRLLGWGMVMVVPLSRCQASRRGSEPSRLR